MRMMLKASFDTERSNEVIRSGRMPETIKEALDEIKPEAAYFTVYGGERTCFLFFGIEDPSRMPRVSEPFFMELNAKVEYEPAMNMEELQRGLARLR